MQLPVGQFRMERLPRFGLPQYAKRVGVSSLADLTVRFADGSTEMLQTILQHLTRSKQLSDFHCVTGWSVTGLTWDGYRFLDLHDYLMRTLPQSMSGVTDVLFRCQDGFRATLPIEDLLKPDVLLADALNGRAVGLAHGGELRLVAPGHYGYKSPKHIKAIEFHTSRPKAKSLREKLLVHPRGRVENEERSAIIPRYVARWIYRPMIATLMRRFQAALDGASMSDQS